MARLIPLLRSIVLSRPVRYVAAPVHEKLTECEVSLVERLDRRMPARGGREELAGRVTAIVKSFERPAALRRLVASLQRGFGDLRVVVADDSAVPPEIDGVELVRMAFDSGVSAGRQAALDRVTSEYTWVLDDDFVMYSGTRLDLVVRALDEYPQIDVVGGPVVNLPFWRTSRSDPSGIFPTSSRSLIEPGTRLGELEVRDKVPNFFVARTERLRLVGWGAELKRLDHADFFTRARGVLATALCESFRCLHAQSPFDRGYRRFRDDCEDDRRTLAARYGLHG